MVHMLCFEHLRFYLNVSLLVFFGMGWFYSETCIISTFTDKTKVTGMDCVNFKCFLN